MDIYQEIIENRNKSIVFVVATIVKAVGSTPRKQGAKLLVFPDGSISGTVGGGDFERLVIEDCLKLITSKTKNLLKKYNFSQLGENATGMCCGGNVEVFMELHAITDRLMIYGGGHIGKELVHLASGSDFRVTVIDDRPDIIDSYDDSVRTHLTEIDYEAKLPELDESCFVVILSRSHQTDSRILKSVINSNCKYIGLIGSKAKTTKMFAHLIESGIEKSKLDDVHTPIGLDINAESPYEIAISILAEIISIHNAKQ